MLKVALIGKDGHQGYAVSALKKAPSSFRLVAVAGGGPGEDLTGLLQGIEDAEGYRPAVYDSYLEMLDRERPDVVSVAPVYHLHQPISLECVKRGIHVVCEKPVALDLEQLVELRAAVAAAKICFAGMHAMRYQPNFLAGYEALQRGCIGRPLLISGQKSYAFDATRPEFYRERATFGSTLCWVAIHALDWTHWMMGDMTSVYAAHTTLGNRGYGECESSGVIAFRFRGGGQGCINFDFLKAYRDRVPQDRCRVAGESGVLEIGEGRAHLTTHDRARHELPLAPERSFFGEFLAQVRGEGTCLVTAADTFEVTRLALLARQSADTDELVRA